MSFFASEFGYTEREVTALMGAHTLGAADIFNSGFNVRNGRSRSSGRSSVDPPELRVNGAGAEVNIY